MGYCGYIPCYGKCRISIISRRAWGGRVSGGFLGAWGVGGQGFQFRGSNAQMMYGLGFRVWGSGFRV